MNNLPKFELTSENKIELLERERKELIKENRILQVKNEALRRGNAILLEIMATNGLKEQAEEYLLICR